MSNLLDSPRLRKLERELERATTYAEWLAVATEHDRLTGADAWRASDETDLLHAASIRRSIARLQRMRAAGEGWALLDRFQEALFRHQGEFVQPELYHHALTGTKQEVLGMIEAMRDAGVHQVAIQPIRASREVVDQIAKEIMPVFK